MNISSFLLGKHLEVKLLGHMVSVYLTLLELSIVGRIMSHKDILIPETCE